MAEPQSAGPRVSVIIPAHNAERYLAQCLESVLGQTLADIEVIVVDDASTDSSPQTFARYAADDARLRVTTKQRNQGVSAARNTGLNAATGRFVAFVDADDYLDATMFDDLSRAAERLGVDVISCGIEVVEPDGRHISKGDFPLAPDVRHEPAVVKEALHRAFAAKLLWYPVRSLYSRALLAEYPLRFDEGIRKGEDSLFNLQALFLANGVGCIRSAPYHYRKHPGSATAKPLVSEAGNIERMSEQVTAFYREHGFDSMAFDDYYSHVLRSDLPTALARLRGHESMPRQVSELLAVVTVRAALRNLSLLRLRAPLRVTGLLVLVRMSWAAALRLVLRGTPQPATKRSTAAR